MLLGDHNLKETEGPSTQTVKMRNEFLSQNSEDVPCPESAINQAHATPKSKVTSKLPKVGSEESLNLLSEQGGYNG